MGYDLGDVCDKLDDVCSRLDDVESAVKANKPDWQLGWWATFGLLMIIFVWIPALVSGAVHSKARYYFQYNAEMSNIVIHPKPYDCWFWSAPLGHKGCHYERAVTSVRVYNLSDGGQSVSYDEGKTWDYIYPRYATYRPRETPSVDVGWVKKDDDE